MKRLTRHKIYFWITATVLLSLFFTALIGAGWFQSWHHSLSNVLYYSPESKVSEDIVLVAIDDRSLEMSNTSELGILEFDKEDYAVVIENLEQAGVKSIGIDIIFSELSAQDDEALLIDTLEKYDNVILGAEPDTARKKGLKPLDDFIAARPANLGGLLFKTDADNTLRRQQIIFEDPQVRQPFALQVAKKYLDVLDGDSQNQDGSYLVMDYDVRVANKKYESINIPLTAEGDMLINYFGKPYSFQTISFADAYEGNMVESNSGDQINLTNKMVLIGEMATGIHDVQYVPVSFGTAMPGVEIHANAIQTILTQRFLAEQSPKSNKILLVAMTAVLLAAFLFLSIGWSIVILILSAIGYFVTSFITFEYGLIMNMIYPYAAIVLTFIIAYIFRYFTQFRAQKKTKLAFSRYVSQDLVQKILENPEKLRLGGVKKELSVFFSDIANFTSISEKTKPEDLVTQLNEYLDEMTSIIMELGGTVDKYIGDAIMAFWGAPIAQKDHAKRACLAATMCQDRLQELNRNWLNSGQTEFTARIGINTGDLIVGNVGSANRFDYTVIGDSVNLASRLEGVNKVFGTEILISESTYNQIRRDFECRELDLIAVKGKSEPVRIYELISTKGEINKDQIETFADFEKGLKQYRSQKWSNAIKEFKKALVVIPDDGPSLAYVQRCTDLQKSNNLPNKWNGVFKLHSK